MLFFQKVWSQYGSEYIIIFNDNIPVVSLTSTNMAELLKEWKLEPKIQNNNQKSTSEGKIK